MFDNYLTGSLPPNLVHVSCLIASGNMFEGTIPLMVNSRLQILDLSRRPCGTGGLRGQLPHLLSRLWGGGVVLAAAYQRLEGIIPHMKASLLKLGMHHNEFQVMSDLRFGDERGSVVLVHNNLLSCHLPLCGNTTAKMSLSGLGNQLSRPTGGFPAWVWNKERDMLLWVNDREGVTSLLKITLASCIAVFAASCQLGHNILPSMSRWSADPQHYVLALSAPKSRDFCDCDSFVCLSVSLLAWVRAATGACPRLLLAPQSVSRFLTHCLNKEKLRFKGANLHR